MTHRTTLIVSTALLALVGAACNDGSDAVDTPGAPSTRLEGEQPTTLPPPTNAPTTVPPATSTAPSTTAPPSTTLPPSTTAAPETTAATTEPDEPTTAPPDPNDFLRQGDEGPRVGLVQFKLVVLGYLPSGADTGVFDGATNSAVLAFQGDYGLIVDGIVGPETDRAISAAAESINPEQ